ncbi:MAG: peptidase C11, partial [Butyrivibrio sp.]|nr:peptidase C11 [Butyrivibrio sp.]
YVAGATFDYVDKETETIAKNLTEIVPGDKIDFVCDYYTYDRQFKDSYYLGETMTVTKDMSEMVIQNLPVGDGPELVTYRFTDIYGQNYWTDALEY